VGDEVVVACLLDRNNDASDQAIFIGVIAPFIFDPRCHATDGMSQHLPPPPPGHRHIADVAIGQK
jgi:hypothetical protein